MGLIWKETSELLGNVPLRRLFPSSLPLKFVPSNCIRRKGVWRKKRAKPKGHGGVAGRLIGKETRLRYKQEINCVERGPYFGPIENSRTTK